MLHGALQQTVLRRDYESRIPFYYGERLGARMPEFVRFITVTQFPVDLFEQYEEYESRFENKVPMLDTVG